MNALFELILGGFVWLGIFCLYVITERQMTSHFERDDEFDIAGANESDLEIADRKRRATA